MYKFAKRTPEFNRWPDKGDSILNKYTFVETIAEGQIGVVLKIRDEHGQEWVLKTIKPKIRQTDPPQHIMKLVNGLQREAHFLSVFRHKNIIKLVETIHEPGLGLCLVMEYAPGGTLRNKIRHHSIELTESFGIVQALLDVLTLFHTPSDAYPMGIVHLDIEPKNILFDKQGRMKLCDFHFSRQITRKPRVEDFPTKRHPIDVRTDICQLGKLFYEMLTFIEPQTIDLDLIPDPIRFFIEKLTAPNLSKRYQNIDEVKADFNRLKRRIMVS